MLLFSPAQAKRAANKRSHYLGTESLLCQSTKNPILLGVRQMNHILELLSYALNHMNNS